MTADAIIQAAAVVGSIGGIIVGLTIIAKVMLGLYRIARRVDDTNTLVQKELAPNGGTSLRDAIDRIEKKADKAVVRAEDAAHHAHFASQHAANALERIERLERGPAAIAVAVAPPALPPAEDPIP